MTKKEIWGDIDKNYQVSTQGRVARVTTRSGKRLPQRRILKQRDNGEGYFRVCVRLFDWAKQKIVRVQRLVAMVFIGPIDGLEVNHKNGIRYDNRVENLEICTHKENMVGRRCPKEQNHITDNQVRFIRTQGKLGTSFTRIASRVGCSRHTVRQIYQGKLRADVR